MINMLPDREKRALQRELWVRRFIFGCVLLGGVSLLGVLLLAPSYVLVRAEHARITQELAEMQLTITGKGGAEDELKAVVAQLDGHREREKMLTPRVTNIADALFAAAGDAVQISSFSFIRNTERTGIILSGIGTTRESLLDFQKTVKNIPGIADAKFTESFITKKVDIRFTLTVTLK